MNTNTNLSAQRTKLASIRTLLSFLRTAIVLLSLAVGLVKLGNSSMHDPLIIAMIILSVLCTATGIALHYTCLRQLRNITQYNHT